MPPFLAALAVMIAMSVGAAALLQTVQENADVAFATSGARVDPAGDHTASLRIR